MTKATEQASGIVQRVGQLTSAQVTALRRALRGDDPTAVVVIPAEHHELLKGTPNALHGVTINPDGDAV